MIDAQGDDIGDRGHCVQGSGSQWLASKEGHHAHHLFLDQERIASKGNHSLPFGPLLITHTSRAGLQLEHLDAGVERPYPGKGCIQVMDEGLCDLLQAMLQGHILHEGNADIAAEGRCA